MEFAPEQLNEIKKRRQFLSDTDSLLICELIDEIDKLNDNRKSLSVTYVKLLSNYFELLDDHIPDWREYCKTDIRKILDLLEEGK